jgi:hypothetical protein
MNTKKHDEDEDPKDTRNPQAQNVPGQTPTQPNFPQPTPANPPPPQPTQKKEPEKDQPRR